MAYLRQPVLDPVTVAGPVEEVAAVPPVSLSTRELDPVVGKHRVEPVRECRDDRVQEADGDGTL